MNSVFRNVLIGAAVVGAIGGVAYFDALNAQDPDDLRDEATLVPDLPLLGVSMAGDLILTSKLGVTPDGGVVAYVTMRDGSLAALDAMPCVRRKVNSLPNSCMRQIPGIDLAPRDIGEHNRFPASVAAGTDCQPVPCSGWARRETP
jgi:hypothetical protein